MKRFVAEQIFEVPATPRPPIGLSVDDVLGHYLDNLREDMAAPERQAYAVIALMAFWDGKSCGDIHEKNCRKYAKSRKSKATARRELVVLRAALGKAESANMITVMPSVWLPPDSAPRPDWLTRVEMAKLLRELRRNKKTRHTARFVICMYYTGSRPGTVSLTTWNERRDGPWVNLDAFIWNRKGEDERSTPKGREPHRIPRRLMCHLKIWLNADRRIAKAAGMPQPTYVIELPRYPGMPVMDFGGALERACERAGVKRITPHVLKHTAITHAIQAGMSLEQAAEYFSTSVATIEKTYWHHSPHHQQKAALTMDKLGSLLPATKRNETCNDERQSVEPNSRHSPIK